YEGFAQRQGDDPRSWAEVARARERIAEITQDIGTRAATLRHWQQAGELWEVLARAHPTEPRYACGQARAIRQTALLTLRRDGLHRSLASLEPLAREFPDDDVRGELADTYHARSGLGLMKASGKTTTEEHENLRKALAIREHLARGHPEGLRVQAALAALL